MKRSIVITGDGSPTLYVPELGEHYHSIHGAIRESNHIFITAAFEQVKKTPVRVLEYGMGTGLNILLTFLSAKSTNKTVYYHTIEKYPVLMQEVNQLNLSEEEYGDESGLLEQFNNAEWDKEVLINESFTLFKEKADFRAARPGGAFDVIYFDAFAPEIQPDLWTEKLFRKIYESAGPGAILTTYSVKGIVRRNLEKAGFKTEKLPGPPGKREITRASKS